MYDSCDTFVCHVSWEYVAERNLLRFTCSWREVPPVHMQWRTFLSTPYEAEERFLRSAGSGGKSTFSLLQMKRRRGSSGSQAVEERFLWSPFSGGDICPHHTQLEERSLHSTCSREDFSPLQMKRRRSPSAPYEAEEISLRSIWSGGEVNVSLAPDLNVVHTLCVFADMYCYRMY